MAVPDFNFGAMENWGLIIYREAILYQPGVTSASYEYWMGTVIAHEIAHMVGHLFTSLVVDLFWGVGVEWGLWSCWRGEGFVNSHFVNSLIWPA